MEAGTVFRAYDVRGIVNEDFDEAWVTHLGKACGTYLAGRGIHSAVVGYDCRHSSPAYHDALTTGLLSTGVDVVSVGMVPTPALYYAVKYLNRQGGIMITASHNPPEYNGFKVWAGDSTIHGAEIQKIRRLFEEGAFAIGQGVASRHDILPTYKDDILERVKLERPIKIVLDGGNGMGGEICTEVLTRMGATVVPIFCDPDGDFPNHHPDPVVEGNMQALMERVKAEGADLGIGLDGDADRLGIVDPAGRLLFGDEVLSLYARELLERKPGSTVIADVKCSSRLFDDIKAHGGNPMMWTTGHSIIKAKMREIGAPLAGEMSGHMFFADNWYGFDDAIYGTARFVALFSQQQKPMTELPGWPASFATREINIPCPDDRKFDIVEQLKAQFRTRYETIELDGARVNFPHGWGLVRASNTQPVLVTRFEADSQQALDAIRTEMETAITKLV
ncbi:MAG: phosphomannomutase/phosphoglucomutase [Bilophila sp.]